MKAEPGLAAFRARRNERGQALPLLLIIWTILMFVLAAIVVDLGNVYCGYRQLQAATDAAALAGAQGLTTSNATAISNANLYSALTGDKNAYGNLQSVQMITGSPRLYCSSTLQGQGIGCDASDSIYNAVQVKMQANVPMYFAGVLKVPAMTITTSATSSMRGANSGPYNVIIIADETRSMATSMDTGDCNNYRIVCAFQGIQIFLQSLSPCPYNTTCSVTDHNSANPVDEVGLMVFPGVAATTSVSKGVTTTLDPIQDPNSSLSPQPWQHPYEYDSSASTPTLAMVYSYNYTTGLSSAQLSDYEKEYQVVQLSSDYRISDSATSLNTASPLVLASANPVSGNAILYKTGPGTAPGMSDIGGQGTFYAGALYAAQAELAARTRTGAQNVIILLSDGDASAGQSNFDSSATKNGTYPSWKSECQQAVTAATAIKNAGTTIYVVAYGAATSGGCSTDTGLQPCTALQDIASSSSTFYSDTLASQNKGQCVSTVNSGTASLNQIFQSISSALQVPRLIPNGTP